MVLRLSRNPSSLIYKKTIARQTKVAHNVIVNIWWNICSTEIVPNEKFPQTLTAKCHYSRGIRVAIEMVVYISNCGRLVSESHPLLYAVLRLRFHSYT